MGWGLRSSGEELASGVGVGKLWFGLGPVHLVGLYGLGFGNYCWELMFLKPCTPLFLKPCTPLAE